jgi:hypothetical protein
LAISSEVFKGFGRRPARLLSMPMRSSACSQGSVSRPCGRVGEPSPGCATHDPAHFWTSSPPSISGGIIAARICQAPAATAARSSGRPSLFSRPELSPQVRRSLDPRTVGTTDLPRWRSGLGPRAPQSPFYQPLPPPRRTRTSVRRIRIGVPQLRIRRWNTDSSPTNHVVLSVCQLTSDDGVI